MLSIPLTEVERKIFSAWLFREKDHIMAIRALAQDILLPSATDTLECINADWELVTRLREGLRASDSSLLVSPDDARALLEAAARNKFSDRKDFWASFSQSIEEHLS